MRAPRRDDAGFTLPELLVAIAAAAVITPVLAAVFVTGVKTTSGTTERLSASNGAEFASSYFVTDVQSANSFSTGAAACFNEPAASTHLLTITRTEGADVVLTGYATANDGTSDRKLVRYSCTNGVANPAVTVTYTVMQAANAVEVTCTPSPCGNSTTNVALAVSVDDATDAGYTFHLNATRRTT